MGASVTVKIDTAAVKARLQTAWKDSMFPLTVQVLADMNEYVRVDQNTLRESSASATDFDAGVMVWNTPYARRVYYTGNPSKDVNANASLLWCEVAKAQFNDDWMRLAEKIFKAAGGH